MKTIKIKLIDISDSYGKLTGDLGAIQFINDSLVKGGFDMSKPFDKFVNECEQVLIYEQNESTD